MKVQTVLGVKIDLFFETVDSNPVPPPGEPGTVLTDCVESGHEGDSVVVDSAERTVVHPFERQPVLVLDPDPAFERIPETHIS